MNNKISAIILAAGQGTRMKSKVQKQYLQIDNKPLLYYTLEAFQDSEVNEIIIVTGESEIEYCQHDIVDKYRFTKVTKIIAGGKERYHSVYAGLKIVEGNSVLVHDGARPFILPEMINQMIKESENGQASIMAVPVKDTIKKVDKQKKVSDTLNRSELWSVQTPQAFDTQKLLLCYESFFLEEEKMKKNNIQITDDAMLVERYLKEPINVVNGEYFNIKITTPEDLEVAEIRIKNRKNKKNKKTVDI